MARYVDGFVLPVRKSKLPAYRRLAKLASKVFIEHGALEYRECVGEEMNPGFGLPFPGMVGCRKGEVVVFAWILYRSKAQRNKVNGKMMKDPRMLAMCDAKKLPFDMARMATGGFEVMVEG